MWLSMWPSYVRLLYVHRRLKFSPKPIKRPNLGSYGLHILVYEVYKGCREEFLAYRLNFKYLWYIHLSIVSFMDDNLSKCQWIFTKLGMCIDIVEIWFGIANGQISSVSDSYLPTRARENRKNSRSGPKLRILDRFQTPQNANKSVQHFPNQPIFTNQWCLKNHKRSSLSNWQRPRTF